MNIQEIIVFVIVFLCMAYAGKLIYKFIKKKDKSDGCSGGCANCPLADKLNCSSNKKLKK
ncbi:FeoB-associated Cys-rich membrane protein [uncultured Bacteroides sp.]|uniref:FeoB-associated Cys-rich membrane protein n=1 Tax=uncultured Bacteroides sp. TaxID=162156 RepID=UPI002623D1BA|nr:FeoB-associated Cys-rich membrane protein [uncultured Bacteroides sp.]